MTAFDDLRVSVIIPNHNKARTLRACLGSVLAQSHPPADIIVVDDASTDDSRQIIREFPVRLICFEANRGPAAARNAGARAAIGDVLFFLDSDIALEPEAIANALRVLREHPECAMVQGIYDWRPLVVDSRVEEYKALCEHFWRRRSVGEATGALVALAAIRRSAFEEVGGFDESLLDAEDVEFGTRLLARSVIRTSDEVVGRHDDVDRFWPYLTEHVRRAVRYGGLLTQLWRRNRPSATDGPPSPRRRVDVAALACMVACVVAPAGLPLALVSAWFLLVPMASVAVLVAVDRSLFGFAWRHRGAPFGVYVVAMQYLMYATQLIGMAVGAVHAVLSRHRNAVNRLFAVVFVAALTVGLVSVVRAQDFSPVAELAARLDAATIAAVLAVAFLLAAGGLLFGVASWRALFVDIGAPVDLWTSTRIFFVGFLTKFVPGRFVALPVLVSLGRAASVGPVRLASVFLLSWSIVALTGLTIGLAAGPAVVGLDGWWWLLAAAGPTIALLAWPDLLNWCIRTGARLLRRPAPSVHASRSGVRRAILAQSLSWVISGHHVWVLAVVAGAPPARSYLVCVAGFAVATVAGILVMVAPDGIGVREAVLAVGLATVLPLPVAGTVILASRVVCTLADVAVGAVGLLVSQQMQRRRPIAAPAG
jgi:hypothetical protein